MLHIKAKKINIRNLDCSPGWVPKAEILNINTIPEQIFHFDIMDNTSTSRLVSLEYSLKPIAKFCFIAVIVNLSCLLKETFYENYELIFENVAQ